MVVGGIDAPGEINERTRAAGQRVNGDGIKKTAGVKAKYLQ